MTGQIIGELVNFANVVLTRKREVGHDTVHGIFETSPGFTTDAGRIHIPGFSLAPYVAELTAAGWNIETIKETP